ncbi:RNA-directed DNA polymerase from mobile element jockey-like protein [Pitangus sulphuratus]|nr:RNA-directed DNA polymerase from mobile element jockey-like protein [Pitangus sulphuratus]
MINSQLTLKSCGICCSSWIPTNLWGLMGFIPESSKSWLMSWQNLSMIFEQYWESGDVSADWKLDNVVPIFKKGKKQDLGNYRSVSLTSVPSKVTEKTILGGIEKHQKDNPVIGHSQHTFMSIKSCVSNLISFYGKVTRLVDQGKPADIIFLDFSKSFNTVSHRILLDKMSSTQLDKHIRWWVSSWVMGQAQKVIVNGVTSDW